MRERERASQTNDPYTPIVLHTDARSFKLVRKYGKCQANIATNDKHCKIMEEVSEGEHEGSEEVH